MEILEQILNQITRAIIQTTLGDLQIHVRCIRNTQDHVFSIKQIAQNSFHEEKKISLAFKDLEIHFTKYRGKNYKKS